MAENQPWWAIDPEVTRHLAQPAALIVMPGCLPLATNQAFGKNFAGVDMRGVSCLGDHASGQSPSEWELVLKRAPALAEKSKSSNFDELVEAARDREADLSGIRCLCDRLETMPALVEDDCKFEQAKKEVVKAQARKRLIYERGFQFLKFRQPGSPWPALGSAREAKADEYWYQVLPFTLRIVDWTNAETLQVTLSPLQSAFTIRAEVFNDGRSGRPGHVWMQPHIGGEPVVGLGAAKDKVPKESEDCGQFSLLFEGDKWLDRAFAAAGESTHFSKAKKIAILRELFDGVRAHDAEGKLYPQLRSLVLDILSDEVQDFLSVQEKLFAFRIGLWDAHFVDRWSGLFREMIESVTAAKPDARLDGLSPEQHQALALAGVDQRQVERELETVRTVVTVVKDDQPDFILAEVGGWPGDELIAISKRDIPAAILSQLRPEVQFTARANLFARKADQVVVRHFEPPLPEASDE